MPGLDPEYGNNMMEIKVVEINAPLNEQRGNSRSHKLTRLNLTRIFTVRVNFMERLFPIIRW